MPISELLIGNLRREVAREGLSHIRKNQPRIFSGVAGCLFNNNGHIVKHNGKDISSEYKPMLALEWEQASDFHAFYPASPAYQSFVEVYVPYVAARAQPQLFEPEPSSSSFHGLLSQGAAQIFIASAAAGNKTEVSGAWSKLLKAVDQGDLVGQWSGWGIEGEDGTWAGIVSWKGLEDLERSSADTLVAEAVQNLKALVELDEYVVSFTPAPDTAS